MTCNISHLMIFFFDSSFTLQLNGTCQNFNRQRSQYKNIMENQLVKSIPKLKCTLILIELLRFCCKLKVQLFAFSTNTKWIWACQRAKWEKKTIPINMSEVGELMRLLAYDAYGLSHRVHWIFFLSHWIHTAIFCSFLYQIVRSSCSEHCEVRFMCFATNNTLTALIPKRKLQWGMKM